MDFGLAGKSFHDTREMREHLTWLIYPTGHYKRHGTIVSSNLASFSVFCFSSSSLRFATLTDLNIFGKVPSLGIWDSLDFVITPALLSLGPRLSRTSLASSRHMFHHSSVCL